MSAAAKVFSAGSHEEWLSARGRRIGGSTIAAIMGYDKYRTPYQVWKDLTGRSNDNLGGNKFVIAGHRLEQAVAEYFAEETGFKIIESSRGDTLYVHQEHDYLVASPDRMYINESGKTCVLECKTTQNTIDDTPLAWYCQLQWYLMITGCGEGSIAWLTRGVDFGCRQFYANVDFQNELLLAAVDFWNNNVLTDNVPDFANSSDIESFYQETTGDVVEADNRLLQLHMELRSVKDQIKTLEAKEGELSEMVKLRMCNAEAVKYFGKSLFTWKQVSRVTVDSKRLKAEKPDIYVDYSKESVSRPFLVKEA